jgi:glycosyltransferase involved in cell wall biosynthesis
MAYISIVTACYNEEENAQLVYERVKAVFATMPQHQYEHIFIDNASSDKTVSILKKIAAQDKNIKIIVNSRNFGHIRSPFFGLMQAEGDAVVSIVCDLQDPPELLTEFIAKWEAGNKIVVGVKHSSDEHWLMNRFRRTCYHLMAKIANTKQIKNFTGFGLYDREVMDVLRTFDDPYPYFRGMITEVGFNVAEIPYHQPTRHKGFTKNNFVTLYDMAMLGMTSYSKLPIRLAILAGFVCATISFFTAVVFFLLKLMFWEHFSIGVAPMLIGMFFFSSIQLFFIGLLGEYVAAIHTHVQKRPLVVVQERINFDEPLKVVSNAHTETKSYA